MILLFSPEDPQGGEEWKKGKPVRGDISKIGDAKSLEALIKKPGVKMLRYAVSQDVRFGRTFFGGVWEDNIFNAFFCLLRRLSDAIIVYLRFLFEVISLS